MGGRDGYAGVSRQFSQVGKPLRVHHFAYAGKPVHRKWFTAHETGSPKEATAVIVHRKYHLPCLPFFQLPYPLPNEADTLRRSHSIYA
ncbi:MAG TPA: hypothetical protein IGS40_03100 [Trichormus sp. M33_DOE_039]|nr:hypothetical protein [Trichormus sp. M33_DOE_039]